MRTLVPLLLLAAMSFAWPIVITLTYNNPAAIKGVQVPFLNVKVIANYVPQSYSIDGLNVTVGSSSGVVSEIVKNAIYSKLSSCNLQFTSPVVALATCLLRAVKDFIGMHSFNFTVLSINANDDLSGRGTLSVVSKITTVISNDTLVGTSLYLVKALMAGPREKLVITAAGGNATFALTGFDNLTSPAAPHAFVYWPGGAGLVGLSSVPIVTPRISNSTIYFGLPIVKYFIGYEDVGKSYFYYFQEPSSYLSLPFVGLTLRLSPAAPSATEAQCSLSVAVLKQGEHELELLTPSFDVKVRAPPFSFTVVPSPCAGVGVLKVDNSYAILNLTKVANAKIVALPQSPVLRLVRFNSTEPFNIVYNNTKVYCGTSCYALLPPRQVSLELTSPLTKTSTSVIVPPYISMVTVKFPPPRPQAGCIVKFVAPKDVSLKIYTGGAVISLLVGRNPLSVVLPCNTKVPLMVGRYKATIPVKSGEWVYLCPSQYALAGESVEVVANMTPPISLSCDGGLSWAVVNNTTFVLVKPAYSYLV